ncbi:MAG: family 16 glycosylhydrolase [Saprospiraceae bacterium]|nr:family 16 glycosylhydrolase [Saprospiraceae bacterium]
MYRFYSTIFCLLLLPFIIFSQSVRDDFEGDSTIAEWIGDDCEINTQFANPYKQGINNSATVLRYSDVGGQYANVRFETDKNLDLYENYIFSIKIYVPSVGLTGNQRNQISLKLQNNNLQQPWTTQSEVIKPIELNQWQTVTFNFKDDPYINLDGGSLPPTQRKDFNRIVLQVNGENNTDRVLAYLDDFYYHENTDSEYVFDYLVWSDEFDGNGSLDTSKWFHQTRLPDGGSWYNGEIQHYTNRPENSFMENGALQLVAKREKFTDQGVTKEYTSARLNSKFAFQYGRVEVRAKLPSGIGTWPAIWTLGKNITERGAYWETKGFGTTSWPACGEIDIMEHWGHNQNFVQSATHTPSSFANTVNHGGQILPTASTDFHVYTFEWTPEKLVFGVDGYTHFVYNPPVKNAATWPFNAEQYLLLNFAIQPTISNGFVRGAMEVDYIRVYQKSPLSNTQEHTKQYTRFYPNPVQNELNIVAESSDSNLVLKIYSMDGILVKSDVQPVIDNIIHLKNLDYLTSGVYLVSYEVNGRIQTIKFVKS